MPPPLVDSQSAAGLLPPAKEVGGGPSPPPPSNTVSFKVGFATLDITVFQDDKLFEMMFKKDVASEVAEFAAVAVRHVEVMVTSGSVIVSITVNFPETGAGSEQKSLFFSKVSQPDAHTTVFTAIVLKPEYGNVIIFDVLETFPATASPTSLVNTVPTITPADGAASGFPIIVVVGGVGAVVLCLLVALVVFTCQCMRKKSRAEEAAGFARGSAWANTDDYSNVQRTPVRAIPAGKRLPAPTAAWGDV